MAGMDALGYAASGAGYSGTREDLIMEHLPQVRWIANRIYDKLGGAISLEDLISTGIVGLINAIDSFDPRHNVKLKTYAEHKIRGAILDSIRGLDGIPAHKRKRLKEMEHAIVQVENRLQRSATDEEIAAELKMSLSEYQDTLLELRAVSLGSLDEVPEDHTESRLIKYVPYDENEQPARIFERAQLEKLMAEAIDKMPKLEKTILSLYYKEGQNLRDIAQILDIHITRASQLKSQAILRLRAFMNKKWPSTKGIYR
jgi:RNA polymerase sigma factor for flagellar operon FliA